MADGIFALVGARADWLLTKQQIIGENIVNANSPAYKPKEIAPFERAVLATSERLMRTSASHIGFAGNASLARERTSARAEESVSGNGVNVQRELADMAQVRAEYGLSTAVAKAFHRMYLLSVRSGG